jgi:hypothetical protein
VAVALAITYYLTPDKDGWTDGKPTLICLVLDPSHNQITRALRGAHEWGHRPRPLSGRALRISRPLNLGSSGLGQDLVSPPSTGSAKAGDLGTGQVCRV